MFNGGVLGLLGILCADVGFMGELGQFAKACADTLQPCTVYTAPPDANELREARKGLRVRLGPPRRGPRRVGFFWLLFFAHAKKSDSPVGETYGVRAAETAGPQAQHQ